MYKFLAHGCKFLEKRVSQTRFCAVFFVLLHHKWKKSF